MRIKFVQLILLLIQMTHAEMIQIGGAGKRLVYRLRDGESLSIRQLPIDTNGNTTIIPGPKIVNTKEMFFPNNYTFSTFPPSYQFSDIVGPCCAQDRVTSDFNFLLRADSIFFSASWIDTGCPSYPDGMLRCAATPSLFRSFGEFKSEDTLMFICQKDTVILLKNGSVNINRKNLIANTDLYFEYSISGRIIRTENKVIQTFKTKEQERPHKR